MSKTWRKILILFCVVAVLVGALVAVLTLLPEPQDPDNTGTDTDKTEDTTVVLTDVRAKDGETGSLISSAEITTKTFGSFKVVQGKDGALLVEGYQGLAPETYQFEDLEETLTNIVVQKLITENGAAAEFGFDDPQASFSVQFTDGTSFAFEIGDEEPLGSGRYLRVKGETKVYLAAADFMDSFALNPLAYIETGLVTSPEEEEVEENSGAEVDVVLRDITLSGTFYGKEGLSFRLTNEADSSEMQSSDYIITKPYLRNANGNVLDDTVLSAHSITAEVAVVARYTKEDLKTYGLDKPYIKAVFHTASRKIVVKDEKTTSSYKNVQEHTVLLSKGPNDTYYAIVDDFPSIYRIASSQIPWAELSYQDCVLPLLFLKDITTVKEVRYTAQGTTYAFALTHYPDEEEASKTMGVHWNGEQMDTQNFRALYQVMMAVSRFGETTDVPTGQPDITLEVRGSDGKNERMDFYYKNASLYLVKDSSGDIYTVKTSRVKNLMRQMENFINGKTVSISE